MVNTFLVSKNFTKSANMLDKRRLNKQCWEAKMVVIYLETVDFISEVLEIDKPKKSENIISDFIDNIEFTKLVVNKYREIKIKKNIKFILSNGVIKEVPISYNPISPDREIFGGFINHPAILMWAGHLNAIKYYYNIHILMSIERGINVNPFTYNLAEDILLPWWCSNDNIINSYKNNLLMKEIVRNEKPWYIYQEEIIDSCKTDFFGCGNLWIAKLPYDVLVSIHNNDLSKYNIWDITDTPAYSKSGNKIIIKEIKEFPRNKGWILLQIYLNDNFPQFIKNYAKKHLKNGIAKGIYSKQIFDVIEKNG